ncbi:DUF1501 domain-containing protein, partial [bacterium]|nr:DUF1501 domain-containing protein [bacterium]
MRLNRRKFLQGAAALSSMHLLSLQPGATVVPDAQKTVVHLLLEGGPDFRHLFAPLPTSEYGLAYWKARASIFESDADDSAEHSNLFSEHYEQVNLGTVSFGILKKAGWLIQQVQAGNVAIINSVVGSETRDHPHSVLVWSSGVHEARAQELCRSGWGGRLSNHSQKRILSVTQQPLLFCNGPHPTVELNHSNANLVDAPNMENFSFTKKGSWNEGSSNPDPEHAVFRTLQQYYQAKNSLIPSGSTFSSFLQTEQALRSLGANVEGRLKEEIEPAGGYVISDSNENHSFGSRRPQSLENLIRGENPLHLNFLARQLVNTYYGFACQDILDFNVVSMMVHGFDTHDTQRHEEEGIEIRLEEILGVEKGLHTLTNQLQSDYPLTLQNLVFVLGGEFGRQLKSNGGLGTDHGRGNSVLVIGNQ